MGNSEIAPKAAPMAEELIRKRLCLDSTSEDEYNSTSGLMCPREFDGWSCINATPAGYSAVFPCPSFITGFDPRRFAQRECLENGSWFIHPDSNKTWSNYTTCINVEDLEMRENVNRIYKTGYAISLIALMSSLFIFTYFRALHCARITIHKNLFISLAINNLLWIIWYETVITDYQLAFDNGIMCRVLFGMVQYFMVATYFWMFCEGLYLHAVLVITFISEVKILRGLYLIGWGVPALLVGAYVTLRVAVTDENKLCWIHESKYSIILSVPVCVSMVANLLFLINIIRLLVKKLRDRQAVSSAAAGSSSQSGDQVRTLRRFQRCSTVSVNTATSTRTQKAARATLILIPLLGLQYVVTPFRPPEGAPMEYVYQVTSALVASLQGLCVSLLFCFFNGEVLGAIRQKLRHYRLNYRRPWASCSAASKLKEAKKVLVEHRSLNV